MTKQDTYNLAISISLVNFCHYILYRSDMHIPKLLTLLIIWPSIIFAQIPQAPQKLRIELTRNSGRVYKGGVLTSLSLEQALSQKGGLEFCTVNSKTPMLSWIVPVGRQTAYQVLVASKKELLLNNNADYWNSGRVTSGESISNFYNGKALEPSHVYYWKVRIWNGKIASPYSAIQSFATGPSLKDFDLPSFVLQKHNQLPVIKRALSPQHLFYDFGKDAFSQLVLTVEASGKADTLKIHLGEDLAPDGSINRKPAGTVRYSLIKIPLMAGAKTYNVVIQPDKRNTGPKAVKMPLYIGEVLPFRYVEIEGLSDAVKMDRVSRDMITADFDDHATSFTSSDTSLNKIWDLCKYTVKATTFTGYYLDGDRERIPYEGDALINQLSHYASDAEYGMAKRSLNYLIYNPTWPTEWSLQDVLIAWNDYLYSGDDRLMRQIYTDLKSKMLTALAREDGLISTSTGKQTPAFLTSIHARDTLRDIVDWPHTGSLGLKDGEGGETDGFVFTNYNAVVNAYYYQNLVVMAELANTLGFKEESVNYLAAAQKVRTSFAKVFIDPATGLVHDGDATKHSSLHANAFASAFGLIPADKMANVSRFIRSRGMACSVYGAQFLLDGIAGVGDDDYALNLITSRDRRSWFNMLAEGATMTMEAWGQEYKPNQDWNHAWGTAPANYIVRQLMGIQPMAHGFAKVQVKPHPGSLRQAELKYGTIRGDIRMKFTNNPGSFNMQLTLPGNTEADVYLPYKLQNGKVTVDGKITQAQRSGNYWLVADVGPGQHRFNILPIKQ